MVPGADGRVDVFAFVATADEPFVRAGVASGRPGDVSGNAGTIPPRAFGPVGGLVGVAIVAFCAFCGAALVTDAAAASVGGVVGFCG